ncbi:MAG: hypothetical protein FJ313_00640 [Gemmatimonadetes bacterium]|nr:hypothetical protein [Gemmatimonadota bacterium]
MRLSSKIKAAVALFNLAAALHAARTGRTVGRFCGVPYDFTPPTPARVRDRLWNERDRAILTPPLFGAGWSVNLAEVLRRIGLLLPPEEEAADEDGKRAD